MKNRDYAIIAVLVILGLFLLWTPQPDSISQNSVGPAKKKKAMSDIDRKIEEQMKSGRFSEELLREKMALDNEINAPRPNGDIDPSAYSKEKAPIAIILRGDNPGERMIKEAADSDLPQRYNSQTPDQRINKKINRDQYAREYEKEQEEAFIQQYIANARRAGYDIRLNEKGEIVSSEYIGVAEPQSFPSASERLPQSVGDSAPANGGGAQ